MSSLKSNITKKIVGNKNLITNIQTVIMEEKKVIREKNYTTKGEILILVKDVDECDLILDSKTTSHIIIKSLTKVNISPSSNLIDEYYEKIQLEKGACVEFYLLENNWYIVSSDGLKLS